MAVWVGVADSVRCGNNTMEAVMDTLQDVCGPAVTFIADAPCAYIADGRQGPGVTGIWPCHDEACPPEGASPRGIMTSVFGCSLAHEDNEIAADTVDAAYIVTTVVYLTLLVLLALSVATCALHTRGKT